MRPLPLDSPGMQSRAATVAEYLASLPEDRRAALSAVRDMILKNLDRDYEEGMAYGMIGYAVPLRVYPRGYHCAPPSCPQPLPFAGLASQKNHMSLYLMTVCGDGDHWQRFRAEWAKTGKKLDMGKCCIRFKKVEDLALDVIARAVREVPARTYVERYEKVLADLAKGKAARARGTSAGKKTAGPRRR